jgi:hypothetical protein
MSNYQMPRDQQAAFDDAVRAFDEARRLPPHSMARTLSMPSPVDIDDVRDLAVQDIFEELPPADQERAAAELAAKIDERADEIAADCAAWWSSMVRKYGLTVTATEEP